MSFAYIYEMVSPTGERYIGSTNNIRHRISVHRYLLRKGVHPSNTLQEAFIEHGEFNVNVLEKFPYDRDQKRIREQYYIDTLKPFYNIRKGVIAGQIAGKAIISKNIITKEVREFHSIRETMMTLSVAGITRHLKNPNWVTQVGGYVFKYKDDITTDLDVLITKAIALRTRPDGTTRGQGGGTRIGSGRKWLRLKEKENNI